MPPLLNWPTDNPPVFSVPMTKAP
ncbi:hypothetical protein AB4Z08_14045 [Chitinophaga sp. RAB17]